MKEIKSNCYKGTRIVLGNEKRDMIDSMVNKLRSEGFIEIQIPIIQHQNMFANKVGEENNNMMYNFTDRGNRVLCLAPEYTAVIQKLAFNDFKYDKDIKVFYVAECFRGEKPQSGRYRQFTQLGVEILNPSIDYTESLKALAFDMITNAVGEVGTITMDSNAVRGLDYYKDGCGFEISCSELGSSKQVCGGGSYDGGIGFAIGIDRLLNLIT